MKASYGIAVIALVLALVGAVEDENTSSRCATCTDTENLIDVEGFTPFPQPTGFSVRPIQASTFPILEGTGVAIVRASIEPCGLVPFHTHPRGSEFIYVMEGEGIIGLWDELTGLQEALVSAGKAFIVPQGQVHYTFNPNCEKLEWLAAVGDDNAGFIPVANAMFSFESQALSAQFGVSINVIDRLKERLANPKLQNRCAIRCGLV